MNSTRLKLLAVSSMLIDHIAYGFLPSGHMPYIIMRAVGRLAFPIFCFLIAEGFEKTSSRTKYALRLLSFFVISEIPYDLYFHEKFLEFESQNVMLTLLLGLLCLCAAEYVGGSVLELLGVNEEQIKSRFNKMLAASPIVALLCVLSGKTGASYGAYGVLLIVACYLAYENRALAITLICALTVVKTMNFTFTPGDLSHYFRFSGYMLKPRYYLQILAVFAALPIALYNGEKGRKLHGLFFYIFYPAHIAALLAIKTVAGWIAVSGQ